MLSLLRCAAAQAAARRTWMVCAPTRFMATVPQRVRDAKTENINVGHSSFLAESSEKSKWKGDADAPGTGALNQGAQDSDALPDGKGTLSPTSTHLFKLTLPLDRLQPKGGSADGPPTVFLLHPSQPLSHVGRLIVSSLTPWNPTITFLSTTPKGRLVRWSDSTDVGDLIRDVVHSKEFVLQAKDESAETRVPVAVPTFADRTRFLRRRLDLVEHDLERMEALKKQCDAEAHRGARRMAVGGLAMLIVYWGTVARLTFWDLGWDIMEPVTYLSGLSMVILGYLWFLYQGREVSYSSVLDRSVSARRQALYKARGFDIDRWADLIAEAKSLRKEISKIAEDYDERRWKERDEGRQQAEEQAKQEIKEIKEAAREEKSTDDVPSTRSEDVSRSA